LPVELAGARDPDMPIRRILAYVKHNDVPLQPSLAFRVGGRTRFELGRHKRYGLMLRLAGKEGRCAGAQPRERAL